jgi:hypothetical protein
MHVNSHALPSVNCKQSCTTFCQVYMSTLYCLMRWQIIMVNHPWTPTTQHRSCGDWAHWRFCPSFFCAVSWTFGGTSFSSCLQACFRAWHPWGLSPVWLYVLGTCVCMSVLDFRAYDVQLKAKLQFQGRVNNNACAQSCTTFCQLWTVMHYLLSTLYVYSILLDAVSDDHVTPPVKPDNTAPELWWLRTLTIFSEFFCRSALYLHGNQLQQLPAGVFSSLTSLRSPLCGCMYWERVCA